MSITSKSRVYPFPINATSNTQPYSTTLVFCHYRSGNWVCKVHKTLGISGLHFNQDKWFQLIRVRICNSEKTFFCCSIYVSLLYAEMWQRKMMAADGSWICTQHMLVHLNTLVSVHSSSDYDAVSKYTIHYTLICIYPECTNKISFFVSVIRNVLNPAELVWGWFIKTQEVIERVKLIFNCYMLCREICLQLHWRSFNNPNTQKHKVLFTNSVLQSNWYRT